MCLYDLRLVNEMLEDKVKKNIRENFEIAATEFNFCFISPYHLGDNEEYCFFGYLFKDNLEKGVVIDFLEDEDILYLQKRKYCTEQGVFYSYLSAWPFCGEYKQRYFREVLRDWKYEF